MSELSERYYGGWYLEPREIEAWRMNAYRERVCKDIIDSFDRFELPLWARLAVMEAINSPFWCWWSQCDGCTAVSEPCWPNRYFPPCLVHDFHCCTKPGERQKWNNQFYKLNLLYKMESWRAALRWLGVTVGWFGWFKWVPRIARISRIGRGKNLRTEDGKRKTENGRRNAEKNFSRMDTDKHGFGTEAGSGKRKAVET